MPEILFLPLSMILATIVLVRYLLLNRVASGIGWLLFFLAVGGFGSGIASAFAWSGFLFLFLGATGLLIVVQDEIFRRRARRKRQRSTSIV